MIGCFPDPYPDELLYSVCARYCERVQYPNKKGIIRELFGDEAAIAIVNLPSNLRNLTSALPHGSPYTVERLINQHTLLPFFTPFLDPKQFQQIWADMEGPRGPSIHMRSGLMASVVQPLEWLRFCPECAQQDKQRFSEFYWHRLHQIPGVEICPHHQVRLVESQVRVKNPTTRHEFITAEQGIKLPKSLAYTLKDPHQEILLKIAQNAAWLLDKHISPPGLTILLKRYRELLAERDLATYNGRVRASKLLEDFKRFYPNDLLQRLQCEIDTDSEHSWLLRLVRSPKGSQHTLRHLLLIQFLGHNAESFFKLPKQFKPFGTRPWPCLNRTAEHFRQSIIEKCEITYSQEHGKPIGTFYCNCGFIYSRTGPDRTEEDRLCITKIKAFGSIWENTLRQLWEDPAVSLRGMARQLSVDPTTVKLHAAALSLDFPRQSKRQTNQSQRKLVGSESKKQEIPETSLENYRLEWLNARKNNPEAGRSILRKQFQRVYTWLRRHDREWLETHLPALQIKNPPSARVDWENRDSELCESVKIVAASLYSNLEKPKQVTTAAIARELGQLALIQKHLDKLPQTAKILENLVESREAFAIRRINWVVNCYFQEGICPQRWQLVRRAGLRPELELLLPVENALNQAMEILEQIPHQHGRDYPPQRMAF